MSLNGPVLYRFGGLTFNAEENTLRRGDKAIPLTPKMLELLWVLVKNQGRLLKKDDLMKEVWADSFVEESNLAVTIRQLRKALGDDAHHPIYIETVPRRGYRFIADVEIVGAETEPDIGGPTPNRAENRGPLAGRSHSLIAAAGLLLIGALSVGSWYLYKKGATASAPVLSAPFASEKLSTSGRVTHAVLSADGKIVVYTRDQG
jgi:DNA-binding winged helix-turn-helix (wHTH) protein